MNTTTLRLPPHFDPSIVGKVWKVDYQSLAKHARAWREEHAILPAGQDRFRLHLLLIDVQNTFCLPEFELFVGGKSGSGAIDDNRRLCEFIYHNLGNITGITLTLDTHRTLQIFHPLFFIDKENRHPEPYSLVSHEDIKSGRWRFNADIGPSLGLTAEEGQSYIEYYTKELEQKGKFELTIWPYHAMLGGIGHALVPAVEEAVFFHSTARQCNPEFVIKGLNPMSEHYSALGPEVGAKAKEKGGGERNRSIFETLAECDALVIAGQAKSHCVAATVGDLLDEITRSDTSLTDKVYLLEDCSSPVVVPGSIDYSAQADAAYQRFVDAGMHAVNSTSAVQSWPGLENN